MTRKEKGFPGGHGAARAYRIDVHPINLWLTRGTEKFSQRSRPAGLLSLPVLLCASFRRGERRSSEMDLTRYCPRRRMRLWENRRWMANICRRTPNGRRGKKGRKEEESRSRCVSRLSINSPLPSTAGNRNRKRLVTRT